MAADRRPRHPDLINADAALKRAARRALDLALQTGTACWVLRDGKMVDIAAEAALREKKPTSRHVFTHAQYERWSDRLRRGK